ncbi:hypothetical protein HMPREF9439_00423 [Parasutterella excrementihominis YIT 11859]|uniref:Uncharacterized protein n=1 Tax=Parasutterella excrementihominis YIT 11859 TaxID=762966 RepID=F3QHM6_9BURK|nr:hypothetical protein HMPREF9439_00423 [Parasutterella excrementihominis YIT 11859]
MNTVNATEDTWNDLNQGFSWRKETAHWMSFPPLSNFPNIFY